jgi:hypothetical protein
MTTNTARIDALTEELVSCTTSAMTRCVLDSLYAACTTEQAALYASARLAQLGSVRWSTRMQDHAGLVREVADWVAR